jgi:ferric-dicitrate binding protein FerR (iron transport regulator)
MTRKRSTTFPPDAAALLRYVSGESPIAEADWIRRWAAADQNREASLAELREAWERGTGPVAEWDGTALWSRIESQMSRDTSPSSLPAPSPAAEKFSFAPFRDRGDSSRARHFMYAVAAVLVVAFAGAAIVRTPHDGSHAPVTAPMREVTTALGETATLSLADGSTVTLAPGSTLRIPTNFGSASREAMLDGEAVFSIKHDAKRSFRVRTRTTVTEDLGTRFVVRAYGEDSVALIAVAEGEVKVHGAGSAATPAQNPTVVPFTLRAGDLAELRSDGAIGTRRGTSVAGYFSWTSRRLTFAHAPLSDVVRVLNRWYDLDIRIDPRLSSRELTTDFSVESATEMLRVLQIALDVEVERHGRLVQLTPPIPSR